MKLDYSVDISSEKEDLEKKDIKTRTSMQSTVMNALASRMPSQPQGQVGMAPAQTSGWGAIN